MLRMNRRTLLKSAGLFALTYPLGRLYSLQTAPRFSSDPFVAGVASGDPTRNGIVLWTKLMTDPNVERDWQRAAVNVNWEIASDERMQNVVRRGNVAATPDLGHSVHVDVTGLDANRWYWYRFRAGSAESPIGRTKTAPANPTDRIRFAFASCQQYQGGYYTAYKAMVREDIDLIVFLGDYIYEAGGGTGARRLPAEEARTLESYRNRYAVYRSDENLREAHRLFPWIITWDDHEVQNNYAADNPQNAQPREDFLVRRAAAYQAHYEWLPMPKASAPKGPNEQIYRSLSFGPLGNFIVLDGRQYRSDQPCGDGIKAPCAEFLEERTMLGRQQEQWLDRELRASRAQWNILANQVRMSVVDQGRDTENYSMDVWASYDTARRRLTSSLQESRVRNPVVITGDIHSNWVCDLKMDYKMEKSPVVATEFIGTSISSGGDGSDSTPNGENQVAKNPHVKFFNNQRGYVRCTMTAQSLTADYRVVEKISVPDSPVSTRASFIIENGRPEAHRV